MLKNFDEVQERVRSIREPYIVSVAAAEDRELLLAVKAAAELGFVRPVLVGDPKAVGAICAEIGLNPLDILEAHGEEEAVSVAVKSVREGGAQVLMKGLVNTSIYMRGILNKEQGLRTGRLLSMMAVYEAPGYHKLVYCSDSGINVAPNLEQKKDIIVNTVDTLRAMGYDNPKVGVLACVEKVNPKMPETVEANELKEMNRRGEITGCVVEGPISYDCAVSKEIADFKGFQSPCAGDCDVLIAPNIHAGNIMGKMLAVTCGAKMAGFIVGAKCPIVMTSRGSSPEEKYLSIVISAVAAEKH